MVCDCYFNKINSQDEKSGGRLRPQKHMVEFRQALEINGLFDGVEWTKIHL